VSTSDADAEAIAAVIRGIYEAFAAGHTEAIESALHPECTVWDVFTPRLIRGREERKEFHATDQAQKNARGRLSWSLEDPLVNVWGDTAVARYLLDFAYQPPNPAAGRVRITDVLRRTDRGWQVVHHHEGLVPDAVPPTNEPKLSP
jgi:ketosteroid isomerase-like protein